MIRVCTWVVLVGCGRIGFDARLDGSADSAQPMFVDTFDRADANAIGNGWEEKTPGVYAISSQHVVRTSFAGDYRDDLVSRPVAEDLLDVEVSIQFTVGHVPPGYPQIHARVQRSTIAAPDTLDGYLLYIDGTAGSGVMQADITRQHGTVLPPPLVTFSLSPPLAVGETYRLRLAVKGTAPVMLTGSVEQQAGAAWTTLGALSTTDSAANAVTTAGAIGFDTGQPEAAGYYTYDEATYLAL